MRALYAMAVGWDMTGKPPVKLREDCLQLFVLASDGKPRVERLNVSLIPRAEPGAARP